MDSKRHYGTKHIFTGRGETSPAISLVAGANEYLDIYGIHNGIHNGDSYGTHYGPQIGNVTGNVEGNVTGDIIANDIQLLEPGGPDSITLNAPSLNNSYTLTFPTTYGNSNEVLTTDGSGNLNWETVEGLEAYTLLEEKTAVDNNYYSNFNIYTLRGSEYFEQSVNTWTATSSHENVDWNGIAALNDRLVVAGSPAIIPIDNYNINTFSNVDPVEVTDWKTVAYSPDLDMYVIGGDAGVDDRLVYSTDDGATWTGVSLGTFRCAKMAWGNGIFMVIGLDGIRISSNGTTWTNPGIPSTDWTGLCYSPILDMWVATGSGLPLPHCVTSTDNGTTWTTRTISSGTNWNDVCWNETNEEFCAVGQNGAKTAVSSDGVNWTTSTQGLTQTLEAVTWSSLGYYCAVGTSDTILTSTDGLTWTSRTGVWSSSYDWKDITWSDRASLFYAVGSNNARMYSSDGITWTSQTLTGHSQKWEGVIWSEQLGQFIVAGGGSWVGSAGDRVLVSGSVPLPAEPNCLMYSDDGGASWTEITDTNSYNDVTARSFVGAIAVGSDGLVRYSGNGVTGWTTANSNISANAVTASPVAVIAVGNNSCATSTDDGATWTTRTMPSGSWNDVDYGSNAVAVGSGGIIATSDGTGVTWTTRTSGVTDNLNSVDYSFLLNQYCAVGNDVVITSTSAINWIPQTIPVSNNWKAVTAANTGFYVTGNDGPDIYSQDGLTWTSVAKTWSDTDWSSIVHVEQTESTGTTLDNLVKVGSGLADNIYYTSFRSSFGVSSTAELGLSTISGLVSGSDVLVTNSEWIVGLLGVSGGSEDSVGLIGPPDYSFTGRDIELDSSVVSTINVGVENEIRGIFDTLRFTVSDEIARGYGYRVYCGSKVAFSGLAVDNVASGTSGFNFIDVDFDTTVMPIVGYQKWLRFGTGTHFQVVTVAKPFTEISVGGYEANSDMIYSDFSRIQEVSIYDINGDELDPEWNDNEGTTVTFPNDDLVNTISYPGDISRPRFVNGFFDSTFLSKVVTNSNDDVIVKADDLILGFGTNITECFAKEETCLFVVPETGYYRFKWFVNTTSNSTFRLTGILSGRFYYLGRPLAGSIEHTSPNLFLKKGDYVGVFIYNPINDGSITLSGTYLKAYTRESSVTTQTVEYGDLISNGNVDVGNDCSTVDVRSKTTNIYGDTSVTLDGGAVIMDTVLSFPDLTANTFMTLNASKQVVSTAVSYSEELISTVVASADASVEFTGLSSSYNSYRVEVIGLLSSVNSRAFYLRTSSNNGVSYDSGGGDYDWADTYCSMTSSPSFSALADNSSSVIQIWNSLNSASGQGASFNIKILSHSIANWTSVVWQGCNRQDSSGTRYYVNGGGFRLNLGIVNAIQFFLNSALITGTFKLYGIKGSV